MSTTPICELPTWEQDEFCRGYRAAMKGQQYTVLETQLWQQGWMLHSEYQVSRLIMRQMGSTTAANVSGLPTNT